MEDSGSEVAGPEVLRGGGGGGEEGPLTDKLSMDSPGGLAPTLSKATEETPSDPADNATAEVPPAKTADNANAVDQPEASDKHRVTTPTPAASENGTTEEEEEGKAAAPGSPAPPPPCPPAQAEEGDVGGGGKGEGEGEGSEDQQGGQAAPDSASFSLPSLELSEGGAGSSLDDPPSSSCSALGAQAQDPPSLTKDPPSLGEDPPYLTTDPPCLEDGASATAAGAAGAVPVAATGGATAAPEPEPAVPAYYFVKWITWKEKKTPIITQSENGPCPLLAIMNTLFLRWKAKLPALTEVITTEDLMAHLGECVLSITPREKAEGMELNFQQNMCDAMAVLPKLSTGLDVNVSFTGVADFEYTPECIVFDLLDIPLYHGWLVDPQSPEVVAAVGKLSYNQLVEKIIDYKHSADSSRVSEGLVAEQFLESTATQLSYHGLCELNSAALEGEISVFFRNNHFSTMIKHQGHLYLLVTDQGFLQEEGLVWESLHNVEGDGNFCDSLFRLCHPPQRAPPALAPPAEPPTPQQQQRQIDQDYLVAMSLQQQAGGGGGVAGAAGGGGGGGGALSDLELARQLQEEEYQQQQQQASAQPQTPQVRGQASGQQGGQRRRDKKEDSDCSIL